MNSEVIPLPEVSGASELASFETPVLGTTKVAPVQWSIEKYNVAQELALSGKTKSKIAKDMKIPLAVINKWLENREFTEYVQEVVTEGAKALKSKRLQILMKTLNAREERAELDGYDTFSNKDGLDIISEIRKETGEDKGNGQSNYSNLLENLLKHSIAHQQTVIQVGGNND